MRDCVYLANSSLHFNSGVAQFRSRSLLINLRDKLNAAIFLSLGCQFYPVGEYLKFVRVPENIETGTEILSLEAHPRNRLAITPVDKVRHIFCVLIHLSEMTRKK